MAPFLTVRPHRISPADLATGFGSGGNGGDGWVRISFT